ncbi:MAG: cation:proton antiporter [Candidatus Micrarchaeota archaeon]|nr:cation:proton antiporter [Candidatus Micrarchaeota archaeon]
MAGKEAEIAALGGLILAGLLGRLFLRKTGFSDIFFLLLLGSAAGALLPEPAVSSMRQLMLPLGAVALLMIILDEGLHLPLAELVRQAHKAVLLSMLSFSLSFAAAFSVAYLFLQDALFSLVAAAIFASVAPELLSSFLSARQAPEPLRSLAEMETAISDALSVMLALLFASFAAHQGSGLGSHSLSQLAFAIALSCALGSAFAALWKLFVSRIAEENEHLAAIGTAAILYAISGILHANGVISVFTFGFFLGNTSHKSVEEVRRFHSEISFFLRTAFFVYLGALLFHSPKPVEVALLAAILSLLLAFSRSLATKAACLLEPAMRKGRIFESVSGRGLTAAVLSVIISQELLAAGKAPPVDLPLLALFVIFFTNAISAFLVLRKKE